MNNAIILGAPRSGTSMVAGLFRKSGCFADQHLLPATISNPRGYFEDRRINSLNNRIIERALAWPGCNRLRRVIGPPAHIDRRAFPIASPQRLPSRPLPASILAEMRLLVDGGAFLYKDPRFWVTLPYWRPVLPSGTRFVVVFREPEKVVDSYLRNAREVYDPPLRVSARWVCVAWSRNYSRLLRELLTDGEWVAVHYNQIADTSRLDLLADWIGAPVDEGFVDTGISRADGTQRRVVARKMRRTRTVYEALCKVAGYVGA